MKIDISIIIPIYNAKDYIADCINSVAKQTFTGKVECILVDDCGQDESISIAENLINTTTPANISFIIKRQERNQGPSAARNAGTQAAQGKYIFFLDADDKITPNCIEQLYALATKHDADYVQGTYESNKYYHMPIYGSEIPKFSDDRRWIKSTLLNYMVIPFTPHNRLVRRQLIIDKNLFFNEKITVREDFYWMFFMAKHVERMAICKVPTYHRGYNADSLTHSINVERERLAYRTLIEDFSGNIDPFLPGTQKTLILNALIMALNSRYYNNEDEKSELISIFSSHNTPLERLLLRIFLSTNNSKILHLLTRLYNYNN